jgi:Flp pilus assembly pilin Flp
MITKLRDMLRHGRRDQEGGISAEYIAVIVIVAAVIAAVWSIGIDSKVANCGDKVVENLFTKEASMDAPECEADET